MKGTRTQTKEQGHALQALPDKRKKSHAGEKHTGILEKPQHTDVEHDLDEIEQQVEENAKARANEPELNANSETSANQSGNVGDNFENNPLPGMFQPFSANIEESRHDFDQQVFSISPESRHDFRGPREQQKGFRGSQNIEGGPPDEQTCSRGPPDMEFSPREPDMGPR